MRILFIGDIFGRPGRTIVRDSLRRIVEQERIDLVIANAENAAAGFGVTPSLTEQLLDLGIDVLTSGNHIWDKREILPYLQSADGNPEHPARRLLRPANYPNGTPGRGLYQGVTRTAVPYAVLNLQGRVFMVDNDDPFRKADDLLAQVQARVIVVDMHAEATSEKLALGWYLDGRVTAVVGTHTHVATADARVLPGGTAYVTDVGMTGPHDGVIGVRKELVLERFLTSMGNRFEPAGGDVWLNAVVVECEESTGKARSIERLALPQPASA